MRLTRAYFRMAEISTNKPSHPENTHWLRQSVSGFPLLGALAFLKIKFEIMVRGN